MVESTALEMRRRGDSTVGSNPTLSAIPHENQLPLRELFYGNLAEYLQSLPAPGIENLFGPACGHFAAGA